MFARVNAQQTALQMRKDLRHWRHAAELASHCAPQEISSLQQQQAEALEIQGDVSQAHAVFQVRMQSTASSLGLLTSTDSMLYCKVLLFSKTIHGFSMLSA
jgi:hypothetical protein